MRNRVVRAMSAQAFRNQRAGFRNYSPPYADKVDFDPARPKEGVPPRGGVPIRKNGRTVPFWTKGELAAIFLFEATPAIDDFAARPERLRFRSGPNWLTYTPHFSVRVNQRTFIVELSAAGCPVTSRQSAVASFAHASFAARGIGFVELSHAVVRAKPRFTDALKLMRYLSVVPGEADVIRATDALAAGPLPFSETMDRSGLGQGQLLALVRTRRIMMASGGPISPDTRLVLPGGRSAAP